MKTHLQNFAASLSLTLPKVVDMGCGSRNRLVQHLRGNGWKRALFLTSEFGRAEAERQAATAAEAGIEMSVETDLPAEPTVNAFIELCQRHPVASLDVVIGMGGGSVLDIAKLVAAIGDQPESVDSYVGKGLIEGRKRGLVCLPTTAGAGSEASPNALLMDPAISNKKAVISPFLLPDVVLIDPELAYSLPPSVTAATAIDALCHCIEAYANVNAHPAVDQFALQGISLISGHLERAVRNGQDADARGALAMGSLMGGMCLGPVNTAAVHALSYPLGSIYHLPHGLANALLLPHVLQFNLSAMPERYAAIALAMGCPEASGPEATAQAGVDRIVALADACSLQMGLRHHGIEEDRLPELAESALQVTRLLNNNPRSINKEEAINIYQNAF